MLEGVAYPAAPSIRDEAMKSTFNRCKELAMGIRFVILGIAYFIALWGCSIGGLESHRIAETWIGRTVEEIQIHWGVPSSVNELEASGGRLLTYHEIEEQNGRDNRAFCEALGIGSGWANLCNSDGEVIRSECMVNVATSDDGIVRDVAIVRDLPGKWFGICYRIIRPAPKTTAKAIGSAKSLEMTQQRG